MPELLIFAGLIVVIGITFFVSRSARKDQAPPALEEHVVAEGDESGGVGTIIEAPVEAAPEAETAVEPPVEVVERPSLRERLTKSRKFLSSRLADALGRGPDDDTWEDVEAVLIQADIGVETATQIVEELRDRARSSKAATAEEVKALLATQLVDRFATDRDRTLRFSPEKPTVWLVVGVNGTGKTTTIGKIAHDLGQHGRSVALAAADTFRAAADEQLAVWASRASAELVKHQHGADPGAVAYDAFAFSRARGLDLLLVDTAGRLHTKTPLMDELAKVRRVIEKEGEVQEVLLVIDATAGQNGLVQAREFAQATGVTGVVLTKLDGTAKGGIALSIEENLDIPIKLIGVGEGIDDMEPFDPETFVDALLS